MSRTLRLVLLREIPDDLNLRQKWNALVMAVDQPQVFYTYEWSLAVHRAYHETLAALLFLGYEGESLCGVAALATDSQASQVSFLCATTGDYCDFLSAPESRAAFVSAVLTELRTQGFVRFTLTNLPADSTTLEVLEKLSKQNGYHFFARTAYECAQVCLSRLERQPAGGKLILPCARKLHRSLNAMRREAPVRFEHVRSWNAAESTVPKFSKAHVARFLATGRISNLARRDRRFFLQELAKLLSESGWLTITQLQSESNVYAWNYGFQFAGSWFWYQPTFDSSREKLSPGLCLLVKIIEEAAQNPAMKIVDLGLGAEGYKDIFAHQTRKTLYVTLHASLAQHAREIARYFAARAVKASPQVERVIRAVLAKGQKVIGRVSRDGTWPTLGWLTRRFRDFLWSSTEVFFLESGTVLPQAKGTKLERLDLNRLATAVQQYVDDTSTCAYLIRSASRLKDDAAQGFGLIDGEGNWLHFAWVAPFDGFFLSELNEKVEAPSGDCIMLFDCWTPAAVRGRGYYGQTVGLISKLIRDQGKRPWIFTAATNIASVRGLERAGFQRRYSLVRQHILWWQRIKGKVPKIYDSLSEEISARA